MIAPASLSETRYFLFSTEKSYLQSVFDRHKNIPFNVDMAEMPRGPRCNFDVLECIRKAKNPKLTPQNRLKLLEEAFSVSQWKNIPVMRKIARLYLNFPDAFEDEPLIKAELWVNLSLEQCEKLDEQYKDFAFYNRIAAYYLLVEIFTRQRRYDEALVTAEKLICMCPNNISSYRKAWRILMTINRLDEALECADKEIALNPDDPNVYAHRWGSLYALGIKKYILEGRVAARAFLKEQLPHIEELPNQIQRHFSHLIQKKYIRNPYPTFISTVDEHAIIQKHIKPSFASNNQEEQFKTFYPEGFDENMALELLKKALEILAVSHSVQDLPDGSILGWWPIDMFVAYTDDYDPKKAVRMVLIGSADGKCITGYPMFGEGVFSTVHGRRFPVESLSISPYNADVWNRDSKKPIKLYEHIRKMFGNKFLRKLKLIEREQLIRLAAVDGKYICEDNEHEYYMYQIPLSFSHWKEAIAGDRSLIAFVYLKVHKKSREAVDIRSSYPQEAITILTTKEQSPKKYGPVTIIGHSH